MNQELFKHENAVRKAEGAWDRQMKREGHLKKESRDISQADPAHMSPTARAFFFEYTESKKLLDASAEQTNLFGGSPANPGQGLIVEPGGKGGGSARKNTDPPPSYPDADAVATPDGVQRIIIAPGVMNEFRAASAVEGLSLPKPTGTPVELNDRLFVVLGVAEHYLMLTPCIPADQWTENTFSEMGGRDVEDVAGLLFKCGRKSYVVCNYASSVAVVAGDPLRNVG